MGRSSEDARWVPLRGPHRWISLVVVSPLLLVLPAVYWLQFVIVVLRDLPLIWLIAVTVGVGLVILGITWAVFLLAYPNAYLQHSTSTLRTRRRSAHFSALTSAQLLNSSSKRRRSLHLLLKADNGLRAVVLIRDARRRTLDQGVAALVLDMIEQSHIAMPRSDYDPAGKFARYNFPDYVTREEAWELVRHPPEFEDALPTPPRV